MPTYDCILLDSNRNKIYKQFYFKSLEELKSSLHKQNYTILNVKIKTSRFQFLSFLKRKISLEDMVIFTKNLSAMLEVGASPIGALKTLSTQSENKNFKEVVNNIAEDIKRGENFYNAFKKYSNCFSPLYLGSVLAGQATGTLPTVLKNMSNNLEKEYIVKKRIQAACVYPLILLSIVFIGFIILFFYVLPVFFNLLASIQAQTSKFIKMLAFFTNLIHNGWFVFPFIIFLSGGIWVFSKYLKTPEGKDSRDRWLFRIPILNIWIRKIMLGRFCSNLSLLLKNGVPIVTSLKISNEVTKNKLVNTAVSNIVEKVYAGKSFSKCIKEEKIFPVFISEMAYVGEQTGKLPQMLGKIGDLYEQEVEHTVEIFSIIAEPVIIGFTGILLFTIILSLFLSMFQLLNSLSI